jgi:uncharacterized protein YbjQ (UPF0145 family)
MLVVTTEAIAGYQVEQVLGEVIGVIGRSRNPFREGVRTLPGDAAPDVVRLLAQYRRDAITEMVQQARRCGANAVVSMRFDHRSISDMWEEICAYGTAVCVVPVPPAPRDPPVAAQRVDHGEDGRVVRRVAPQSP